MAKLKGKSKTAASAAAAAASAAAASVERASCNDKMIADPAPSSEPVEEISKAAAQENAAVLDDKSEGAANNNKEEETENGGLDEKEGIELEEQETKDGLDAKLGEEVDDVEGAKDGLEDKSEEAGGSDVGEADKGDQSEDDAKEEDGLVEPVGTDIVPEGGKMADNDGNVDGEAKVEEVGVDKEDDAKGEGVTPNKKPKRTRRRKKNTAASSVSAAPVSNDAGKTQANANKQGAPVAEKELKMADGMGLVFMCNAKTKQDCFHYKILGLPDSKKEMVAKIYKGMRLFLFDFDLKLMYGIYEAASPGGYSIEPKAFNSAFPAQVRFRVLNDCLPLPQEKFKAAIKENYHGKNKFDCLLSPEQVKELCKLFQKAGKIPEKKIAGEVIVAEPELPPPARGRRKTRKAIREEPGRASSARGNLKNREVIQAEPGRTSSARGRKRTREVIREEPERISSHGGKRSHRERGRGDDSIPRGGGQHRYAGREHHPSSRGGDHLYATRREVYPSLPPPRPLALPPPLPTYAYGREEDKYYYRRDLPPPQPMDPRDYHRAVELEPRPPQPVEYYDARSSMYRGPIPYKEALHMASASYAAPPAAGLAPPAYAPPGASLAPPAYVPSSSLYYRY